MDPRIKRYGLLKMGILSPLKGGKNRKSMIRGPGSDEEIRGLESNQRSTITNITNQQLVISIYSVYQRIACQG